MSRSLNEPTERVTRLLAGLNGGREGGENAAESIARALDHAADPATPPDDSARIDDAAIFLIKGADPDTLLGEIELDRFAGLLERTAARLAGSAEPVGPERREVAWDALDLVRRPALLRRIEPERRNEWADRILALVESSNFTLGPLLRQRAELYGSRVLFDLPAGKRRHLSWRRVASRVEFLGRVLLALRREHGDEGRVAILSENRLEMALIDLACLTSGLVNVMIPANATETDVDYILKHSGASTVIVSGPLQLRKVLRSSDLPAGGRRVVTLDTHTGQGTEAVTLESLAPLAEKVSREELRRLSDAVRIDDLATVMYTSGTTGTPKGIRFTQRNIVFKRFARALALPEIGENDVFLCYLPLFHTFGRYLELIGCIFWGARYCFLASTSVEGLLRGMQRHRPTVFISVPKKWIELHEQVTLLADPLEASDEALLEATRSVTGGRLRWGLSAAGHLDSEIFRMFAAQGVELLSGFGMTEATGGITMTAPGDYRDGSLGTPLPGIEATLAEDGELLIRGPYVMQGYLDPPDGDNGFDDEGWLHSGDLMRLDDDGHLQLVDRKKEIYKNVQGQTIAPQRVENLFREFESVGRAFLVGDHREYNTLLIYPNPSYPDLDFETISAQELRDHYRSLVVSANKFLAPYERIVDFAVIGRDLDAERGELTPKGSPRRRVIEGNFSEIINELYRRTSLNVGGVALTVPNWLFQLLGLTAQDLRFGEDRITLPSTGATLTVRAHGDGLAQVGSCLYRHGDRALNMGTLLITPRLWLGNEELLGFVALDTTMRQRQDRSGRLGWAGRIAPYESSAADRAALEACLTREELDLADIDLAARMLGSERLEDALGAVDLLERVFAREEGPLNAPARIVLCRGVEAPHASARRRAFLALVPIETEGRFPDVLWRFIASDPGVLDEETRSRLAESKLRKAKLEAFIDATHRACTETDDARSPLRAGPLLSFLAAYGALHPMSYRRLRAFLERMGVIAATREIRERAIAAGTALQSGFRQWLGRTARIAVDPETGQEYGWSEVVAFDEEVPQPDRNRLLAALRETAFLREAVFLFSKGGTVRLSDVPPGGVWIRLLGRLHGKSVYRITVQTRFQGSFDLAVNVNHDLPREEVEEEIHWLILSGDPSNRNPLVEDFGGYWPEQDLWSEEFIAGETLLRALRRLSRRSDDHERIRQAWPFFAWATLSANVDFWHRSAGRLEIADPSMTNIVVPTEDYMSDVRIVSLSRRRPHRGLLAMMRTFRDDFIAPAEEQFEALRGLAGWPVIFSSLLEVLGESAGAALFARALEKADDGDDEFTRELRAFLDDVGEAGFVPMRLHFAIERYRRWAALSAESTPQARALTLRELYDTYGLAALAASYPEHRVRFFLETVFRDSPAPLTDGLRQIIRTIRSGELPLEELIDAVDELRAREKLDEDDAYFLARLSYPYLRPEDAAGFVRSDLGGKRLSEIVVTYEDHDGRPFRVRHALNPKEVERLLRLFLAAKLDVRFRPEHQYLVALNERTHIIAGIYYEIDEESRSAHLEKIVVAERYRRMGVADGLMNEFFNRLRAAGLKTVTTGFFRPEYFYAYGFRIEKRYAGLVKSLEESDEQEPER